MTTKRVSIRKVAERAGVSVSTVSLVLNGKGRISAETRKKVTAAADALGFIPDRTAAQLRSGKSTLLGLVINDISNPFFAELCAAFETGASEAGYLTVIANSNDDAERQRQLLESMIGLGVAGIVLCPAIGSRPETLDILGRKQVPYLICIRDIDDPRADFIGCDDFRAGRLAAEHLLALGHETIAFVGGSSDLSPWVGRVAGIRDAARARGRSVPDDLLRQGPPTRNFGRVAGADLFATRPDVTAVIAYNDLVASGVFIAARAAGLTIGAQVSIVGIDNLPESESAVPPLTTVEVYPRSVGRRAAMSLADAIARPDKGSERIVLTPQLIERCSTAPRPT